jgi:tRNA threonylcarbamoyladenosine biosynthesis protein TsaE
MAPDALPTATLESDDADATERLAALLGRVALPGLVLALEGEMGAGKTTFVRGLARGLDSPDAVSSPTYTLMHAYRGRIPLKHFDAWMSAREGAFLASGGGEDLLDADSVCALEWSEEVQDLLPDDRLTLRLVPLGLERRRLVWRASGPLSERVLSAFLHSLREESEPSGGPAVERSP